jgi:hypothetical protein
LKIERNETNSSREDYFTIKSGKLTKRVDNKQTKKKRIHHGIMMFLIWLHYVVSTCALRRVIFILSLIAIFNVFKSYCILDKMDN